MTITNTLKQCKSFKRNQFANKRILQNDRWCICVCETTTNGVTISKFEFKEYLDPTPTHKKVTSSR